MEQHPVPQNVTTFQFRLIGDMTLKQFGYLAGGIILAYISFKLPLPFFFSWPLALFFGLGGFGLAFVPVEERPMDIWISSFFKNIYNPTQYVWHKTGPLKTVSKKTEGVSFPQQKPAVQSAPLKSGWVQSLTHSLSNQKSTTRPPSPSHPAKSAEPPLPQKTGILLQLEKMLWGQPSVPSVHPAPAAHTRIHTPGQPFSFATLLSQWFPDKKRKRLSGVDMANPFGHLTKTVVTGNSQAVSPMPTPHSDKPAPPTIAPVRPPVYQSPIVPHEIPKTPVREETHQQVRDLEQQLGDTIKERESLQKELTHLREQSKKTIQTAPVITGAISKTAQAPSGPSVRIISGDTAVRAGIPRLTTFPNIVTGIIKDEKGNLLPGALVTVRDMGDMPLRALKTNKLGQFAASTPLPSGTYIVETEDPQGRFTFDRAQITVNGTVLPALEIAAKTQKQIERDKLAKAIFGNT